jgi:hypothetical protein
MFTSRHASAPVGGVLWNGIQSKLFVEFKSRLFFDLEAINPKVTVSKFGLLPIRDNRPRR